jgi:hypothetical protein
VSDPLQQVIDIMMAKDFNQRYANPEQAAQALQPFLGAGMDVIKAPPPDQQMSDYLIWLEKSANGTTAPLLPPPPPPRGSGRLPPPLPVAARVGKDEVRSTRKVRKKRKVPMGAPVAPPPGMEFDVELVPSGLSASDTRRLGRPRVYVEDTGWISRRGLILGLLAGAALLIAVAVGGMLASGGPGGFLEKLGLVSSEK